MGNRGAFTRVLALLGTVLAWFPIFATVTTGVIGSIEAKQWRIDYLMPAELFPVALAGIILLMWAAWRARARREFIGWGLLAAVVGLIGSQALAVVTGLADGRIEPQGWPLVLVMSIYAIFVAGQLVIDVGGVLLLRDLSVKKQTQQPA